MIERIFLGWDEPLVPLAARFLFNRYRRGQSLDLRDVAVVLPGGRAGRKLKLRLLELAEETGLRLVPPRIIRPSSIPESFYTPTGPLADGITSRQVWADVLRTADPDGIELLFGDRPAVDDAAGWHSVARRIQRLHHDTTAGGHRFSDVATVCEESHGLLHDDSDRWRILAGLQDDYENRLAGLGLADVDLERIAALARGGLRAEGDFWLIGIVDLSRVAARMVEEASGAIGALVHAPVSEAVGFDSIGLVDSAKWRDRKLEVPEEMIRVAGRPDEQAALLIEELARMGPATSSDVVIGTTDAALEPYVREWIESVGLPLHFAGGTSIARSRPFRLLRATADYLDTREWEDLAALLRHPDVEIWCDRNVPDHRCTAEVLDKLFAEHLPAHFRESQGRARAVSSLESLLGSVVDRLLLSLSGGDRRHLREWMAAILEYLADVYSAVAPNPARRSGRRVVQSLNKIRDAAVGCARLPAGVGGECTAAGAIRILLAEIESESMPDEPETAPIEMLGWLELAVDDAPHAFIVGVNEGALPESVNADTFLPDSLREQLGISCNATRYARDAVHLMSLIESRVTVRLITGRMNESGDPLRPSRLLLATSEEALARRVLRFAGEGAEPPAHAAPILTIAGSISGFGLPPESKLRFDPPTLLRVTDFGAFLRDPYIFALERLKGLQSIDDRQREMDGLAFGNLGHVVLERFGASTDRDTTDPAAIRRRVDDFLEEEVGRRYGRNAVPAVHLQIELLRSRLHGFAEWQAARAREGWKIVQVEGAVPESGVEGSQPARRRAGPVEIAFDVDGIPVRLRGRIDRVDHHPESGRWALLDYKTGETVDEPEKTHRKKDEWIDLQLPLYRHLAAALTDANGGRLIPDDAPLELGYIRLPRDPAEVGLALARWSDDQLDAADEAARAVVRELRKGFVVFDEERSGRGRREFAPLLGTRLLVAAGDDEPLSAEVD